jgi:hypothetical protein
MTHIIKTFYDELIQQDIKLIPNICYYERNNKIVISFEKNGEFEYTSICNCNYISPLDFAELEYYELAPHLNLTNVIAIMLSIFYNYCSDTITDDSNYVQIRHYKSEIYIEVLDKSNFSEYCIDHYRIEFNKMFHSNTVNIDEMVRDLLNRPKSVIIFQY